LFDQASRSSTPLTLGHHSAEELAGGFCFLNSAAIASRYLIDQFGARVAILDVDYHHGNGTQSIFYLKSNPLFVSIHGKDDYPFFWGSADEKGEGEGLNFNFNYPLPSGTEDAEYLEALENVIQNHIIPYKPTFLVISLGVDTYRVMP
jgi:acetoin utilization deacetylase AcuC-like enzyme